jgi:hypothetical protein
MTTTTAPGLKRGRALNPLLLALCLSLCAVAHADIEAVRFRTNPLFDFDDVQMPCDGIFSINFASPMKVPHWLPNPLGRYYMYFSNHHGYFIQLAYADKVEGPWTVYAPPTLTLEQVYKVNNNTYDPKNLDDSTEAASPEIYVDEENRLIRMYYHRRIPSENFSNANSTSVAFSTDGIHFTPVPGTIAAPYVRVFTWDRDPDHVYLVDRVGRLLRSADGYTNLEWGNTAIGDAFTNETMVNGDGYTGLVRHIGVMVSGDLLYIFGTRIGDAPERILYTWMDLDCLRTNWKACAPVGKALEGFRSEYDYEGVNAPIKPSQKGSKDGNFVHQLRDPAPFADKGKCYIFYAIAGESGIAGARIDRRFCYGGRPPRGFDPDDDESDGHVAQEHDDDGHVASASLLRPWVLMWA